jgi:hypothetical protein
VSRSWRNGTWLLAPVLLVAPAGLSGPEPLRGETDILLCARLPEALPDLVSWQRSSAYVELSNPPRQISYTVYLESRRSGVYGVTHYRARFPGASVGAAQEMEGVQWILGSYARRFEVERRSAEGACVWRELEHGSPAYDAHLGPLLSVYGLHQRLLQQRDTGGQRF